MYHSFIILVKFNYNNENNNDNCCLRFVFKMIYDKRQAFVCVFCLDTERNVCNISGLYCLSKVNWYHDNCNCYQSCNLITYYDSGFSPDVNI